MKPASQRLPGNESDTWLEMNLRLFQGGRYEFRR